MAIIALAGNKGGTGKTTLCVNLATALAMRDSVALIDADPQQSSYQWGGIAGDIEGLSVLNGSRRLASVIDDAKAAHTHVMIDCPPSARASQTAAALAVADAVLIPVQPSPLDLWATLGIEDQIHGARLGNPGLRALVVINQMEPRTKLSQVMRAALGELAIDAAETTIRRRVIYRTTLMEGRSLAATGKAGEPARAELHQLIDEVLTP
ncbi:MAG: AAA family ATPase [Gammaproteobacteria bacterium]